MALLPRASLLAKQLARHSNNGKVFANATSQTLSSFLTRSPTISHNHNATAAPSSITQQRSVASLAAGQALDVLVQQNPHVEVIRYHYKNVKMTLNTVNTNAEALATGLLDTGFVPGDVVLSWLPLHHAEQHILQFACSKAGLVLYNLDPDLAKTDPEVAKEALKSALELTKANMLISLEAGDDVNYMKLVEEVVIETQIFDFVGGRPFLSPSFPDLRVCATTAFEHTSGGFALYKDFVCPTGDLEARLQETGAVVDGTTPLMGELVCDDRGVPTKVGKVLTNEDVVKKQVWPEMVSVLKKEYKEIEGIGAVF